MKSTFFELKGVPLELAIRFNGKLKVKEGMDKVRMYARRSFIALVGVGG